MFSQWWELGLATWDLRAKVGLQGYLIWPAGTTLGKPVLECSLLIHPGSFGLSILFVDVLTTTANIRMLIFVTERLVSSAGSKRLRAKNYI